MKNNNSANSDYRPIISLLKMFVFPVVGLIFLFISSLFSVSENSYSQDPGYQDDHLFFSGIRAGMTGKETDSCLIESDWFGGKLSDCAKESVGQMFWDEWYDTRTFSLSDGGDLNVSVRFNSLGNVHSFISKITYDQSFGTEKYEERLKYYYEKFVNDYDLWQYEEYISDTYEFDFIPDNHTYYESTSLIYNINVHKCHLWIDKSNNEGFIFLEMTNAYRNPNVPVYSFVFINFVSKERDQGYYLE